MERFDARSASEVELLSGRLHDSWLDVPDEVIVQNGELRDALEQYRMKRQDLAH